MAYFIKDVYRLSKFLRNTGHIGEGLIFGVAKERLLLYSKGKCFHEGNR